MFLSALGAEAANLALRYQATGGVFIAGGGVTTKLLLGLRKRSEVGTSGGAIHLSGARAGSLVAGLVAAGYRGKARSWAAYASAVPLIAIATSGDDLAMNGVRALAQRRRGAHQQRQQQVCAAGDHSNDGRGAKRKAISAGIKEDGEAWHKPGHPLAEVRAWEAGASEPAAGAAEATATAPPRFSDGATEGLLVSVPPAAVSTDASDGHRGAADEEDGGGDPFGCSSAKNFPRFKF
jgi:hypothetical protein